MWNKDTFRPFEMEGLLKIVYVCLCYIFFGFGYWVRDGKSKHRAKYVVLQGLPGKTEKLQWNQRVDTGPSCYFGRVTRDTEIPRFNPEPHFFRWGDTDAW